MTNRVSCRECGHVNQVDASRSGSKFLCGGCGLMGTIPGAQEPASESAEGAVVRFACPSCGRKYATKVKLAGKKIRCNGCGGGVRVPSSGTSSRASPSRPSTQSSGHSTGPINLKRSPADSVLALAPDEEQGDDSLSRPNDLDTHEDDQGRRRSEPVLPSRTEAMESVRRKVAEQEAVKSQQKAATAKKRKRKRRSSDLDPKDTLILAGGITGFVALLAVLSWGYPGLRFPVGGSICVVGFLVYVLGLGSIKQLVADEGFHHVIMFRFLPPYQWYFVATRWRDTKDYVAFLAAGLVILGLGLGFIKASPIASKAEASEKAFQQLQRGDAVDAEAPAAIRDLEEAEDN